MMATTSEIATELPTSQEWRDILVELLPAQGSWSEEEYLVLTDHLSSEEKPERDLVEKRGDYAEGGVPEY
jgi:hypothetical protein